MANVWGSHGSLCPSSDAHHRCQPDLDRSILDSHRLGWIEVAYRIHRTEPVQLGDARKLHTAATEDLTELHLECRTM